MTRSMPYLLLVALVTVAALAIVTAPDAANNGCYQTCVTNAQKQQARTAICRVFGRYCRQALSVSACESGHSTRAYNGQYLGLFQMGSFARSTYGHSASAWGQARAAYRYFVASGRDWSPWQCRPHGGLAW